MRAVTRNAASGASCDKWCSSRPNEVVAIEGVGRGSDEVWYNDVGREVVMELSEKLVCSKVTIVELLRSEKKTKC